MSGVAADGCPGHRPRQSTRNRPRWSKIAVAGQYGPVSEALHGYDERVDVESVCRITRSSASFVASGAVAEAR